ncbi:MULTISPECIES: hypothetical protein [Paenibacillus]|uniref:hypothetical protein n=1 Tax=Paenibacillus TaxID=44249 RepID=UPI0022B8BAC2|nr:hypothetical protein [Paenibacillus caseinilyticus]MCZ8520343.1 hypothetical protein [Paenibacillus caseinilyticus]
MFSLLLAVIGALLFWCPYRTLRSKIRMASVLFLAGYLSFIAAAIGYYLSDTYYDRFNILGVMFYLVSALYLFGCYAWYNRYALTFERS